MSLIEQTWRWLRAPAQWSGSGSIPIRVTEHLLICGAALTIASLVAVPLGLFLGRRARLAAQVLRASAVARAVPTLGTIALVGALVGSGIASPVIALVVLAFPTLLVGALSGIASIPPDVSQAGPALGMTPRQSALQVDFPLALPSIVSALRAAALQVVSTATLCAYVRSVGLGAYLFDGLDTRNMGELFGCTVLIIALVLLVDTLLTGLDRVVARRFRTRDVS